MFLTRDASRVCGRHLKFSRPSRAGPARFPAGLDRIGNAYRGDRDTILKNVAALREGCRSFGALRRWRRPPTGDFLGASRRIAGRLLREVDRSTGHRTAPKFPQCGIFELLWRAGNAPGSRPYREPCCAP